MGFRATSPTAPGASDPLGSSPRCRFTFTSRTADFAEGARTLGGAVTPPRVEQWLDCTANGHPPPLSKGGRAKHPTRRADRGRDDDSLPTLGQAWLRE